jgi:oligopeptidase B
MKTYCPYTNIRKQNYPALLFIGGLNDPRVGYWEPAKFIPKIRDYNTSDNPVMLYTQMGFGHGGASGRYQRLKETAMIYSFYISLLNKN